MFLIAAAVLASASIPPHAPSLTVQATATIRIIASVRLKLDGSQSEGAPPPRNAVLRFADGTSQPAKLIEFQ
jgi:deferrochelatase/peroxidase EfeB